MFTVLQILKAFFIHELMGPLEQNCEVDGYVSYQHRTHFTDGKLRQWVAK